MKEIRNDKKLVDLLGAALGLAGGDSEVKGEIGSDGDGGVYLTLSGKGFYLSFHTGHVSIEEKGNMVGWEETDSEDVIWCDDGLEITLEG